MVIGYSHKFIHILSPTFLKHFAVEITDILTEWSSVFIKALMIEAFLKSVPPLSPEFYSKPLGPNLQDSMLWPHAHWLHSLCLANRDGLMLSTVRCILISEKFKLWRNCASENQQTIFFETLTISLTSYFRMLSYRASPFGDHVAINWRSQWRGP